MRKYFYIYKSTLIENLSYIPNIILGFSNFFIMMFVFLNLWDYIYSDSTQIINGYTMKQMIWYVLVTEVLWFGSRNRILIREISQDIKTGNIAYNINKPYNYVFYIVAKHLGEITIKLILFIIVRNSNGNVLCRTNREFQFCKYPIYINNRITSVYL